MRKVLLKFLVFSILCVGNVSCYRDSIVDGGETGGDNTLVSFRLKLNLKEFASTYHQIGKDPNATPIESTINRMVVLHGRDDFDLTPLFFEKEDLEIKEGNLVAKKRLRIPSNHRIRVLSNVNDENVKSLRLTGSIKIDSINNLGLTGTGEQITTPILMNGELDLNSYNFNNWNNDSLVTIIQRRTLSKVLVKTSKKLDNNKIAIEGGEISELTVFLANMRRDLLSLLPKGSNHEYNTTFIRYPYEGIIINNSNTNIKDDDAKVLYVTENLVSRQSTRNGNVTHFLIGTTFRPSKLATFQNGEIKLTDNVEKDLEEIKSSLFVVKVSATSDKVKDDGTLLYFRNQEQAKAYVESRKKEKINLIIKEYHLSQVFYHIYIKDSPVSPRFSIRSNVLYNITVTGIEGLGASIIDIVKEDKSNGDGSGRWPWPIPPFPWPIPPFPWPWPPFPKPTPPDDGGGIIIDDKNIKYEMNVEPWHINEQESIAR
ncbi:hypothetical protein [Elizabethkingia anophelis]|uniref:hypothetical protein n=1 Tax=Elizabethkingia anophelis TaxID=1117645 RepID=UPI0013714274|nr:hypothetical protein [Elizabethkingia anophelis]MYY27386.1 hypothetical protein [Elizabethkingia anophelis]